MNQVEAEDVNAFKTVKEMYAATAKWVDLANKLFLYSYDKKTYKYTLIDLIELDHEITELDKYVFVVHRRVG